MKNVTFLLLTIFSLFSAGLASAQNCQPAPACQKQLAKPFSNCAAAFLNNKMLVNDYSRNGRCIVEEGAKGKLMVSTVNLSFESAEPFKSAGFKVAIKNEETGTLWLFSEETYREIELESILSKCQRGDKIVLLTVDNEFSLPHNEIAINWGC
jgi:hypothetical protein